MVSIGVSFIIPLLFLIGITLTNSILFQKKFEQVLPLGMIECALLIYITGFINLRIGFYLCILLCIVSIPLLCITQKQSLLPFFNRHTKSNSSYSLNELFFTDLFWVFLVLYTLLFGLNLGKSLSHWDEFSHWGVMAKELIRLDKFYYLEESPLLRHKDYPPFTTILQYLWCRLCGEFKERHLYNAEMVFSLSLILSLLSPLQALNGKKTEAIKRITSIILMPFFIIILSLCCTMGEASFYQSIYTESIMACLFLYGLFVFAFEEHNTPFAVIRNTLYLSALLLVKQIAIYFFAILFLIYIAKQLLENKINFFKDKKNILYMLCMLTLPSFLWLLWQNAVAIHAPAGQFDSSNFSLTNILAFITGKGEEFQYITTQKYFTAIFTTPIINKPFPISYVPLVLILFILVIVIGKLEKDSVTRRNIYLLGIGCFINNILYIGVMFISYLYGFHRDEALNLACYDRYMCSVLYPFILSIIILLLYVLCSNYQVHINILLSSIILGCIVALIPFSTLQYELRPGIFCEDITEIYDGDCQNIINTTSEDASVLVIRQNDLGTSINILAYKTLPRVFDDDFFSFGEPYYDGDVYTKDYTVNEFTELLKDFDYLYTSKIDDQFIERYQILFGDIELTNNLTFRIEQTNEGSILLKKIS